MNRNAIVLVVLFVVLLGVMIWQFLPSGGSGPAHYPGAMDPIPGTGTAQVAKLRTSDVDIDALLREIEVVTFDYEAEHVTRNPMRALVGGEVLTGDMDPAVVSTTVAIQVQRKSVDGIVYNDHNPVAVVDNEVVEVGYTYANGVQVHGIEAKRVVFKVGDSFIPVELKEL